MPRTRDEPTLRQLEYLVALVDRGHFGQAAEACGVSQPTLSAQLRRLEAALGAPLVDRAASPLRPTPLGRRVAGLARGLLAGRDEIAALARAETDAARGTLRLGAIPTVAPYLVPDLVAWLARGFPELALELVERPTPDLTERLRAGELDLALVATDESDPAWSATPLGDEPFVAYLAAGHPLLARESLEARALPRDRVWLLAGEHCFRDQVVAACGTDLAAGAPRFESGALDTLRRMVDRAGGLTLLPRLALAGMGPEERARVRPFAPPAPARTLRLLVRRAFPKRRLAEELAAALAGLVGGDAPRPA